jgi:hypothetical protein
MTRRARTVGLAAALGAWVALIACASVVLWRYSSAPGSIDEGPARMPAEFRDETGPDQFVLLMAVHPRCPCSRATIAELSKILTHSPRVCRPVLLAFKPGTEPDSWIETGLCRDARLLGAEIQIDVDGKRAIAMGMQTSGQVLLYDPRGNLRYQGGITSARGHQGDNAGQRYVERILHGDDVPLAKLPVFGCSIVADSCVAS